MRREVVLFKKVLFTVFVAISLIAYIPPAQIYYSSYYPQNGRNIKLLIAVIVYLAAIIKCARQRKIDQLIIGFMLYCGAMVISSILTKSGLVETLWTYSIAPGCMLLIVKHGMEFNKGLFLNTVLIVSIMSCVLFLVPYFWGYSTVEQWKLFYITSRACYLNSIVLVLATAIPQIGKKKYAISIFVFIWCISTVAFAFGKSLTMFLVVSLILWCCVFQKINTHKFKNERAMNISVLIIIASFFYGLILLLAVTLKMDLLEMVLNILGKKDSFFDRVYTWNKTLICILQRPLFGYGSTQFDGYIKHINPHNELLYLLFRRGVFGVIALGWMISFVISRIHIQKEMHIRNGFIWLLFCISVGGLVEVYNIVPMIMILAIMYYYSESCAGEVYER